MTQKHLIIIMGVSGCGKTTIAKHIAEQLSFKYLESDNFHSAENKQHMKNGQPLTDDMRWPWIQNIWEAVRTDNQNIVLANSGLKSAHRAHFRKLNRQVDFIYLQVRQDIIQARLKLRQDHFMPALLLESQFRDMQAPIASEGIYSVDGNGSLQAVKTASLNCAKNIIQNIQRKTSCG